MQNIFTAAAELQRFLTEQGWEFCFIGGLAANHWAEPRMTRDVDVTLLTGLSEDRFIKALLSRYQGRIPKADEFALKARVLLLQTAEGIGIDIALGFLPFEEDAVRRAKLVEIVPNVKLKLCSAEDLIVFKAFASRPLDWRDVETVIARQGGDNWIGRYVERQLAPLAEAKEQPEILHQLKDARRRVAAATKAKP